MAVVHPNNYCVLYWMEKLGAFHLFKDEWLQLARRVEK